MILVLVVLLCASSPGAGCVVRAGAHYQQQPEGRTSAGSCNDHNPAADVPAAQEHRRMLRATADMPTPAARPPAPAPPPPPAAVEISLELLPDAGASHLPVLDVRSNNATAAHEAMQHLHVSSDHAERLDTSQPPADMTKLPAQTAELANDGRRLRDLFPRLVHASSMEGLRMEGLPTVARAGQPWSTASAQQVSAQTTHRRLLRAPSHPPPPPPTTDQTGPPGDVEMSFAMLDQGVAPAPPLIPLHRTNSTSGNATAAQEAKHILHVSADHSTSPAPSQPSVNSTGPAPQTAHVANVGRRRLAQQQGPQPNPALAPAPVPPAQAPSQQQGAQSMTHPMSKSSMATVLKEDQDMSGAAADGTGGTGAAAGAVPPPASSQAVHQSAASPTSPTAAVSWDGTGAVVTGPTSAGAAAPASDGTGAETTMPSVTSPSPNQQVARQPGAPSQAPVPGSNNASSADYSAGQAPPRKSESCVAA